MQTQLNERKIFKGQSGNLKPATKSIELRTGVRLDYVEQGEARGLPVIFLHGLSDSWRSYELLLPYLPASIHAFSLSQRGHGDSRRPQSGYGTGDFAADVAAFMDAQQIESAVIVGHSLGSFIAQRFALDYPDRIRGLVLLGSCTTLQGNSAVAQFRDALGKFEKAVDFSFALEFQQSTLAQAIPPTFLVTVVQESLKVPARVWKAALEGMLEEDFSKAMNPVKAATLIIWGNRDAFFPASEQQALVENISGSQLLVYEHAGHALHWEEPARVAADLLAFIEGLRD